MRDHTKLRAFELADETFMHYHTQQRHEPSLRARDQREQLTWGFPRSFGAVYAHLPIGE